MPCEMVQITLRTWPVAQWVPETESAEFIREREKALRLRLARLRLFQ